MQVPSLSLLGFGSCGISVVSLGQYTRVWGGGGSCRGRWLKMSRRVLVLRPC